MKHVNAEGDILTKVEETYTHLMTCMQSILYAQVIRQRLRDYRLKRISQFDTTCASCKISRPTTEPKKIDPPPTKETGQKKKKTDVGAKETGDKQPKKIDPAKDTGDKKTMDQKKKTEAGGTKNANHKKAVTPAANNQNPPPVISLRKT